MLRGILKQASQLPTRGPGSWGGCPPHLLPGLAEGCLPGTRERKFRRRLQGTCLLEPAGGGGPGGGALRECASDWVTFATYMAVRGGRSFFPSQSRPPLLSCHSPPPSEPIAAGARVTVLQGWSLCLPLSATADGG